MYARPSTRFSDFYTTSAVIGATTTRTLLAAPGADRRYRLVYAQIGAEYNLTGMVRVAIIPTSVLSADFYMFMTINTGAPAIERTLPEPGLILPTNEPLRIVDLGSVASQEYGIVIAYYIDTVT